jgi:peptidoglycan/xylan/chitin deacetylase (PgdA/CDA1 family)
MMRVIVAVIAALTTLGLAAFGVVVAQQAAGPDSLIALAAHMISPGQGSEAAPSRPAQAQMVQRPAYALAVAQATVPPTASLPAPSRSNLRATASAASATALPVPSSAAPIPPAAIPACGNPDAIGLSRVVEIDTTGGPAFGSEHFKQYDFLRDKEVVLTFDDGPWPKNTPMVLRALKDNCIKATFFEIGEHATWHPELTRELIAAGMTVGTHTWSHKDLARNPYAKDIEQAKQEIEMGVSAVQQAAAGGPIAPFFRFPDLQQPPELMAYLGARNIATFSTDIDTFDFKLHNPEDVIKSAMTKLAKNGKGILLMHDFQNNTAEALPELLRQLKDGGYKIVHMVAKEPVTTLAKYDDMVRAQDKYSSANNTRPESSVVKTISR